MSSDPCAPLRSDCRPTLSSGSGDKMTRGPVHVERRATTSASMARSANTMLGCDFNCAQALLHEMVSLLELDRWPGDGAADWGSAREALPDVARPDEGPAPAHAEEVPHPPHPLTKLDIDPLLGQLAHGLTEFPRAAQKAFPNGSSAHARQFDGSPVQSGVSGRVERRD